MCNQTMTTQPKIETQLIVITALADQLAEVPVGDLIVEKRQYVNRLGTQSPSHMRLQRQRLSARFLPFFPALQAETETTAITF